ncbi:hypothetical protein BLNAU_11951 [Blattamonas nauphoetae]|uniref:Uncharacterized protein n=1 Tax=Blattamonas nauphoetae TaxID=2049346 RepID=A0ABQ9XNT8_9EUKA|nr:hypothetical protein BLNAU_11951 [Blattamonas nauphoetae]
MMKEQNRSEAGLRRIKGDLSYRNNILEGISETSRKQGKDKLGWRDRGQKTVSSTSRVKHIFINRKTGSSAAVTREMSHPYLTIASVEY